MGKTLATILIPIFLATATGGCTPEGRSLALGLMTHAAREKISRELNPHETHIHNQRRNQPLPENVTQNRDGSYRPAPGYTWVNPKNNNDLRVRAIPNWDPYIVTKERAGDCIIPPPSFAYLEWEDKNRDGHKGKDELIGLGNHFSFKQGQNTLQVQFGGTWQNIKDKRIMLKVEEAKTGIILSAEEVFAPIYSGVITSGVNFPKQWGKGILEYNMKWYVNGEHIKTRDKTFFIDYSEK